MIIKDKTQRVVITGMGIVCPMGNDVETVWQAMLECKNGMNKTTIFDASTFPSQFGAEVKDYDYTKYTKYPQLHKNGNRGSLFSIGATAQACKQARIDIETDNPADGIDRTRLGIYLGAGEGSVDNDVFFAAIVNGWNKNTNQMDWAKWAEVAFSRMSPMRELEQEPNMPAAHIAMLTAARGPTRSCLTACAASTQAVGEAMMLIRKGNADVIIAGGAHSMIHPLGVMGRRGLRHTQPRSPCHGKKKRR
jgi:3-oxoacyl-[acyl-carrier-protein] synthase II